MKHNNMRLKLFGKKIFLGIGGSISACKIPELIKILKTQGADVRIMLTDAAKQFITPLSLQILSGYKVYDNIFDYNNAKIIHHIELAKWPDLIVLVPATANLIARITAGIANDCVTTICLASNAQLVIVPSMNNQMYNAIITQENINRLKKRGILIWGPVSGKQACGDYGYGRMLEPYDIFNNILKYLNQRNDLTSLNIMITAGPTRESLDPIKYITNHSSGKMGFSIAHVASQRGANVTLITGPVLLNTPSLVNRIDVITALEMELQVMSKIYNQHIFICNAAITDYRLKNISVDKIKNIRDNIKIKLIKNPDIVARVGSMMKNRPFVVGFAAETCNIKCYAKQKLENKKLDLICANNVSKPSQGFNSDKNSLHLFWKNGDKILPLNNKLLLSEQLLNEIMILYNEKNRH